MKNFSNINDILDFAINAEQEAVDFYNNLAQKSNNAEMKKTFEQFAQEEMGHKAKLIGIKDGGTFTIEKTTITDLKISDYLVDEKKTGQVNYQDALVIAMKKEKAAFKLYSNLAKKAPNEEIKMLFLSLAQEEAKHKLRFEIEYDEYVLKEN